MNSTNELVRIPLEGIVVGENYVERNDVDDLAKSIELNGLLQPVLLRPVKGGKLEIVCGHRRYMAAKQLGHSHIAAIVKELNGPEAAIAQIVENSQRVDAHPLDEAEAYAKLQKTLKVEEIAARVGRGLQYVRDRIRLNELVPDAKQAFRLGWIELGHAIELSRLVKKDQTRAFENGLFIEEQILLLPDSKEKGARKARTVRELKGWIDSHVNFDAGSPVAAELFPDTIASVKTAETGSAKIIPITYERYVDDAAKSVHDHVYTIASWIRADGEKKSKRCDHAVLGLVTIGPDRGQSFDVCIHRTCKVHRPEVAKLAEAKAKHGTASKSASNAEKKAQRAIAKQREAQALAEAERKAFADAEPAIKAEIIKQLEKMEIKPTGKLADALVEDLAQYGKPPAEMGRGKDAKSLLRYLAYILIERDLDQHWAHRDFPKAAKEFGFKLEKVLPKPNAKAPAKPGKSSASVVEDVYDPEDDE